MSLFGSATVGADNRRLLLTIRAGRMFRKASDNLIHPDTRSGVLTLVMEASGVIDMKWEAIKLHHAKAAGGSSDAANEGPASESTVVMPGGAKFQRVEKCKTGRVFVIDFDTRQLFYWLQEPEDAERDATTFRAIKSAIEGSTRQGGLGAQRTGAVSTASTAAVVAPSAVRPDAAGGIQLSALTSILGNLTGNQPAAAAAAGAASSSAAAPAAGGISAAQLASAMNVQRTPNINLNDVVRGEPANAAYRANPAHYMSRVYEHLPPGTDASANVSDFEIINNPEVQSAADVLDSALQDPNGYREILHSFNLQPPAGVPPSTWGLLQAILDEKPAEGSAAAAASSGNAVGAAASKPDEKPGDDADAAGGGSSASPSKPAGEEKK